MKTCTPSPHAIGSRSRYIPLPSRDRFLLQAQAAAALAATAAPTEATPCSLPAGMRTLDEVLPAGLEVGALKVSAQGAEGWLLEGATQLMTERPPPIVVLEWRPALMRARGWGEPVALLKRMWAWGYTDISHSGPVCDARWANVTSAHHRMSERKKFAIASAVETALKQPTWCKLVTPESTFAQLVDAAHPRLPESILFHHVTRPAMLEKERLARLLMLEQAALMSGAA